MGSIGWPTWAAFFVSIFSMMAIDRWVIHRGPEPSVRRAAISSVGWLAAAALFGSVLFAHRGVESASAFAAGYLLEQALSVDNVFVFLLLFTHFAVPREHRRRVLFWGVFGAVAMRLVFVAGGTMLVHRFHWLFLAFGVLLVVSGVKLVGAGDDEHDVGRSAIVRAIRRVLPVTDGYRGAAFVVRESGKRYATPLLLVLCAIEGTDLLFAADSIPAVVGVTSDPFVAFTSNVFAVLGLRSLYFLFESALGKFRYLKYGIATVLVLIGAKMLVAGFVHVSTAASLAAITAVLGVSMLASLRTPAPSGKPAAASLRLGE
jgi:tellurite resistance protein TerC